MKSTPTPRLSIQKNTRSLSRLVGIRSRRFFVLTLVSLIAVAALLGVAASAHRANRAAKARAEQANAKSAVMVTSSGGKQQANAPQVVGITATLTDNVTPNTNKVAPGATVNYTAVITSTGAVSPADDALNAFYNDVLDSNTTYNAGSVHAAPIAFDDTYNWVGNTQLDTTARALPVVTVNDIAVNATLPAPGTDTFTLTPIAGGATNLSGVVSLAANGSFVYTPPLGRPSLADGASVTDFFTYTIKNSADASLIGTGKVNIVLTGRVWYLQAGAGGDGRSNTPSGSPANMSTAADKSTDFFYIFSNAGSLNGPFSVDAGQQLLGQGVNLFVNAITLFTAAAPIPTTTNTGGSCVTLVNVPVAPGNNTLSGFNIGNCTGGTAITGANVGTLNVSTMSINTNGGGLDLTGVGTPTVNVVLSGLTSTSGKNVNLVGLNGTFTLANGALSGAAGNAFDVNGGNAGITYSGTISNSTARQVSIINKTSGTVALSGAISGTGTGIFLNANGTSIINFTGGVILSTGTNAAFTATSSGTVSVTGANNTIASTTGTPLNITTTTIGAGGVTFKSIACNGATNGIVLNGTGAVGLTVTGDGASDPANTTRGNTTAKLGGGSITLGSGGTIQNTTGSGVLLTNTNNLVLTSMNITNAGGAAVNSGNNGITANTVGGMTLDNIKVTGSTGNSGLRGTISALTLQHVDIDGNGTALTTEANDNWNVRLDNLTGTCAVSNSLFFNSREDIFTITNGGSSNLTLTVTNSEFRDTDLGTAPAVGDAAFQVLASGSAVTTLTATGCTFKHVRLTAFHYTGNNTTSGTVKVMNSVFGGTAAGGDAANQNGVDIDIDHQGQGTTLNFEVSGNTTRQGFRANASTSINIFLAGLSTATSQMIGTVKNNVIGIAGVANSGSDLGAGIALDCTGAGTMTASVTGNTVNQVRANSGNVFDMGMSQTAKANLKLRSNTFNGNPAQLNPQYGIHVNGGTGTPGENNPLCLDIGQNTVSMPASAIGTIDLDSFPGNVTNLVGYAGGTNNAGQIGTFFSANNTLTGPAPFYTGAGGTTQAAVAPCSTFVFPTLPQPVGDKVGKRLDNWESSITPTSAVAQAKAETSKAPVVHTSSKDGIASVTAKATPKASAAEVARIYRSERPISHHAVRSLNNALSQDPNAPLAGETINVPFGAGGAVGTLPAGKIMTIKYSATVNVPPLARQVSTQGTVSGTNFSTVQTDDFDLPGAPVNPTVTLIDTLMTWNGVTSTDWNTATNWTQPAGGTQYAPGIGNPAVNDVVIPAVATQPTIPVANNISIYSLSLANTMTLTIDPARTLTISGTASGSDLTLNGTISGGALSISGVGPHAISGTGSLTSSNTTTIANGAFVLVGSNLQMGSLVVNSGATFDISNRTLSLSGPSFTVTGTPVLTTGSTVVFNGTAAQQAAGIAYNNLTINNTAAGAPNALGATLTGAASVAGTLALTSNDLNTSTFTLTQPNTTASTGAGDVVGTVTRTGGPFGLISLTFGNPNNIITFTGAGTRPSTMTVVLAKTAPASFATAVTRNYTITQTGGSGYTATVRLHYLDSELGTNIPENTLGLRRLRTSDSHWVAAPPPPTIPGRDGSANWIEALGVLAADLTTQWTFSTQTPTATGGVVTGRIVDQSGAPVEGAVVRLTGTQNRKFITDANGVYRFDNVEATGFYTVTPSRANYTFNPASRSFSQLGETTEAAFGATVETSNLRNPLDTPEYFVRQHYIDFLGREPDEAGFNFWSDQILSCGGDQMCIARKRENVSAAYFLSIEFRKTGGLVDGLYRASYGVRPDFAQFMPDTRTVGLGVQVGQEGWDGVLEANKVAFINQFVNRVAFHQVYDNMDSSLFVDTLIGHTGVSFTSSERDALVSGLSSGTMTRAEALRSIAENNRFVDAKFNESFVMMEYFGYLRRNPDAGGFQFWLAKLNEFGGNFEQAEMVKAFIVSGEYRDRFPR